MSAIKKWVDPFVLILLATLSAGLFIPTNEGVRDVVGVAAQIAIAILFLTYGLRLPTREVIDGMRHFRLQGAILAMSFIIFPLLGLFVAWITTPAIGATLATGVLFLCLLPSTVQGSVALTSVARGNVPAAVCAATVSNVLGIVFTPLLVLIFMGSSVVPGIGGIRSVFLQLLLPFIVGQIFSRWVGPWVRARKRLVLFIDRGSIVIMLFSAVANATAQGVWTQVHWSMLVTLIGVCLMILALTIAFLWWVAAPALKLVMKDRIVLMLCGSQKSLATGLPMAAVLFPPSVVAALVVPMIMYHQLQLIVGAILSRRLGQRIED